jgi:hypothetical protein
MAAAGVAKFLLAIAHHPSSSLAIDAKTRVLQGFPALSWLANARH